MDARVRGGGNGRIVSHAYNGAALLMRDPLERLDDPRAVPAVEIAGRLVSQNQALIIGQGPCDRDALLAAGHLVGGFSRLVGKVERIRSKRLAVLILERRTGGAGIEKMVARFIKQTPASAPSRRRSHGPFAVKERAFQSLLLDS